jgi:hypothetical protein
LKVKLKILTAFLGEESCKHFLFHPKLAWVIYLFAYHLEFSPLVKSLQGGQISISDSAIVNLLM